LVDRPCGLLELRQLTHGRREVRIQKDADEVGTRQEFMQQAKPLRLHLVGQQGKTGGISARSVEAFDQSRPDRIAAHAKDDGHD
jgi:hypothetical protein